MTLAASSRIGPYEVVAPLGAGGMGEVYRARDSRLGRDVAIKALPEALAHDAERVARFEREARLLASLNHPNIGGIHGLEEANGHRYLILEFIEGETLAQRLLRGALPMREALATCRAVAAALEAAHESGVIHRDLKPGNVMVRPDGEVKVLDFGLAKGGVAGSSSDVGLSASPTMTYAYGATTAGMILGTAAYMSPEQARGKAVDRRTDIWSFGCLLYECLAGRQAFEGETVSDVIARILEREPDWSALPPATSPGVHDLLRRCLDKDARQRLRDMGEARLILDREMSGATTTSAVRPAAPAAPRGANRLALVSSAVAILALAALGVVLATRRGDAPSGITHVSIALPDSLQTLDGDWTPDGGTLALLGFPSGDPRGASASQIYVRRRDDFEFHELPGTTGARGIRTTPDGRSVVFRGVVGEGSNETRLARVPLDGSVPPVTIAPWQPNWNSFAVLGSGEVVVLDRAGDKLFRIPARGGAVREIAIDRGGVRGSMRLGALLPGDRGVLVTGGVYRDDGWRTETGVLDLKKNRLVMPGIHGGNARYVDGALVFSLGQVLLAAPFDLKTQRLTAAPVAVATGLRSDFSYTAGLFGLTRHGTLVFLPGGEAGNQRRIGLVDPAGRLTLLPVDPRPYQGWPSATRDARAFTVRVTNAQGIDEVWYCERARGTMRRLVSWPQADCVQSVLAGDGRTLAYTRIGRDAEDGLYLLDLDGAGRGTRVLQPDSTGQDWRPESWSPDGQWLVVSRNALVSADLFLARLSPGRDSIVSLAPLRVTEFREEGSDFSQDGSRLAYMSDETGRWEVYVAPFADGKLGRPVRVTEQGGRVPEWQPDGRQLAIHDLSDRREMILDLGTSDASGRHPIRDWFDLASIGAFDGGLAHDGSMIVLLRGPDERTGPRAIHMIFGWTRGLKARMAKAR